MLENLKTTVSGSGYDDLRGMVINYGYDFFDNFNLTVYNNKVKWHGQVGYFAGIAREVIPQASKVAEGIYFVSWSTGVGGDNVVFNFNEHTVNAHLFDMSAPDLILNIHGKIFNVNTEDTVYPHALLTPDEEMLPLITKNFEERKLLPDYGFVKTLSPLPEDVLARQELMGKSIIIKTVEGELKIFFDGEKMHLELGNRTLTYMTTVTKIADAVYFISWENDAFRGHMVCNVKTKQAFQHLRPSGERKEEICNIVDFKAR